MYIYMYIYIYNYIYTYNIKRVLDGNEKDMSIKKRCLCQQNIRPFPRSDPMENPTTGHLGLAFFAYTKGAK